MVLEKTLESPFDCKEIQPVNPKGNQSWIFIGKTDTNAENPILWPPVGGTDSLEKTWCWERLKAGGEGDDRELDDWMASPTGWTWAWASPEHWWWTGKPGVLQSMGSGEKNKLWYLLAQKNMIVPWASIITSNWTWTDSAITRKAGVLQCSSSFKVFVIQLVWRSKL